MEGFARLDERRALDTPSQVFPSPTSIIHHHFFHWTCSHTHTHTLSLSILISEGMWAPTSGAVGDQFEKIQECILQLRKIRIEDTFRWKPSLTVSWSVAHTHTHTPTQSQSTTLTQGQQGEAFGETSGCPRTASHQPRLRARVWTTAVYAGRWIAASQERATGHA